MTLYLLKDNNELISHCKCERAYSAYPAQQDCPWCGCGWLFSCLTCRKAFTFARCVDVPESLDELAHRDYVGRFSSEPSDAEIAEWVEEMTLLSANIAVGEQYVCLDGRYVATSASGVHHGWHAAHNLDYVPQVAALTDRRILDSVLMNVGYWESNAIPHADDA